METWPDGLFPADHSSFLPAQVYATPSDPLITDRTAQRDHISSYAHLAFVIYEHL